MVVSSKAIMLGPYQLLERLAQGAYGEVYRGKHTGPAGFQRIVALKRLKRHVMQDPSAVRAFENEARIGGLLLHHNIAQTIEFGQHQGEYYLAMEYVDGVSFQDIIKLHAKHGYPIPPALVLELIAQACDGLHYAHEAKSPDGDPLKLVHRDMKPSNLMLSRNGVVKVMDFGIARVDNQNLTDAGFIKGTPRYLSPEVIARHAEIDRRADVFSLGSVFYELLRLRPLFDAQNLLTLMSRIREADVSAQLREIKKEYPKIVRLMGRIFTDHPKNRYRTARELARELRHLRREYADDEDMDLEVFAQDKIAERAGAPPKPPKRSTLGTAARLFQGFGSKQSIPLPKMRMPGRSQGKRANLPDGMMDKPVGDKTIREETGAEPGTSSVRQAPISSVRQAPVSSVRQAPVSSVRPPLPPPTASVSPPPPSGPPSPPDEPQRRSGGRTLASRPLILPEVHLRTSSFSIDQLVSQIGLSTDEARAIGSPTRLGPEDGEATRHGEEAIPDHSGVIQVRLPGAAEESAQIAVPEFEPPSPSGSHRRDSKSRDATHGEQEPNIPEVVSLFATSEDEEDFLTVRAMAMPDVQSTGELHTTALSGIVQIRPPANEEEATASPLREQTEDITESTRRVPSISGSGPSPSAPVSEAQTQKAASSTVSAQLDGAGRASEPNSKIRGATARGRKPHEPGRSSPPPPMRNSELAATHMIQLNTVTSKEEEEEEEFEVTIRKEAAGLDFYAGAPSPESKADLSLSHPLPTLGNVGETAAKSPRPPKAERAGSDPPTRGRSSQKQSKFNHPGAVRTGPKVVLGEEDPTLSGKGRSEPSQHRVGQPESSLGLTRAPQTTAAGIPDRGKKLGFGEAHSTFNELALGSSELEAALHQDENTLREVTAAGLDVFEDPDPARNTHIEPREGGRHGGTDSERKGPENSVGEFEGDLVEPTAMHPDIPVAPGETPLVFDHGSAPSVPPHDAVANRHWARVGDVGNQALRAASPSISPPIATGSEGGDPSAPSGPAEIYEPTAMGLQARRTQDASQHPFDVSPPPEVHEPTAMHPDTWSNGDQEHRPLTFDHDADVPAGHDDAVVDSRSLFDGDISEPNLDSDLPPGMNREMTPPPVAGQQRFSSHSLETSNRNRSDIPAGTTPLERPIIHRQAPSAPATARRKDQATRLISVASPATPALKLTSKTVLEDDTVGGKDTHPYSNKVTIQTHPNAAGSTHELDSSATAVIPNLRPPPPKPQLMEFSPQYSQEDALEDRRKRVMWVAGSVVGLGLIILLIFLVFR